MCAVQVGKWMPSCPYDIFFKLDMYINNHKFRHIYIYIYFIYYYKTFIQICAHIQAALPLAFG